VAHEPAERYRDAGEFAVEMETGPARAPVGQSRPQTFYERNPVLFWQGVSVLLALALIAALVLRH
jgi:hypothetical protein